MIIDRPKIFDSGNNSLLEMTDKYLKNYLNEKVKTDNVCHDKYSRVHNNSIQGNL